MKGRVYLYFCGVMPDGGVLLTNGSFKDLEDLGTLPNEGMSLGFYDLDADDENRPTYLCADGVLHFDDETRTWRAFVDPNSFCSVPRPEVGE